jgi:hypothetical protein
MWYRLILKHLIVLKRQRTFRIGEVEYSYFYHSYNTTYLNERAVEIPYFRRQIYSVLKTGGCILEIGNVLSHYERAYWDIVDKYEVGKGVVNVDIVDYRPKKMYDCIVAISTFEHIGFDEVPKDTDKVLSILLLIRQRLLKPGGRLIFSIPTGYNLKFEEHIRSGRITGTRVIYMKRIDWKNSWVETNRPEEVFGLPYTLFATGLIIIDQY